jgi:hypothetical protein
MDRGDRREDIFVDDVARQDFLKTLAEVCLKTDWQVHAYCLMRNRFHMVLETPKLRGFGMKPPYPSNGLRPGWKSGPPKAPKQSCTIG